MFNWVSNSLSKAKNFEFILYMSNKVHFMFSFLNMEQQHK